MAQGSQYSPTPMVREFFFPPSNYIPF
jgi:hypothetical protein